MKKSRIQIKDQRLTPIIIRFSEKELQILQKRMKQDNVKVKAKYIRQKLMELLSLGCDL
ncbi:MAG: hypothetical protein IPI30_14625 [Saprospiraceae bacterium]|nr:hypothetical protein [Candidatus Vicinibacter affinis]